MEPAGRPALKLLISDVSSGSQQFGGLAYDRVWVQGTVKQKVGSAFRLDDGTGTVLVALAGIPQAADEVADGCYTLVVGKVVSGAGQLHIKAHKVVNLSVDPEAASQRMMHWNAEVVELQRKVYPALAAAAQQQQAATG